MSESYDLDRILKNGESDTAEFKLRLTSDDLKGSRKQSLIARIKFMTQDDNEAIYLIGIDDIEGKKWKIHGLTISELNKAAEILQKLCDEAGVDIIEETQILTDKGIIGKFILRRRPIEEVGETISINVAGRVNAGKSTLIGTLITQQLDDGSGKTRTYLLRHPHEIRRGQTSDIHIAFIAFDKNGNVMPFRNPFDKEECGRKLDAAAKIVTLFDAPGHAEFSKTMIRSILGSDAQYGMILIPAPEEAKLAWSYAEKTGLTRLDEISREHMILMGNQELPMFIVISRIDAAKENELEFTRLLVKETLRDIGKIPIPISDEADIETITKELVHKTIVPIFEVSTVSGEGLELLTKFISKLKPTIESGISEKPALAYVDKVYRGIPGTHVVVTGTVYQGIFKDGQKVLVGPDASGEYHTGRIASIEMFKKRVEKVKPGDSFGFDIKGVNSEIIRRGVIIADIDTEVSPCREFEANIVITKHARRITEGYSPVYHSHTIHQTVELVKIYGKDYLTVGDFAQVRIRFIKQPENVYVGDKLVLREANTRAIGTVREIIKKE